MIVLVPLPSPENETLRANGLICVDKRVPETRVIGQLLAWQRSRNTPEKRDGEEEEVGEGAWLSRLVMANGGEYGERRRNGRENKHEEGAGRRRGGMGEGEGREGRSGTKRGERGSCDQAIYSWQAAVPLLHTTGEGETREGGGQHGRRCEEECRLRRPAGCTVEGATR